MAFLAGYDYRRTLYFVKDGVVSADHQVEINPTEGASAASGKVLTADFQADFDDIRATDGANSVADQWRQEYESGVDAVYWHELNKVGSSLLSANAASGQAVVNVNDGTVFAANDYVLIVDDNLLAGELAQIQSISTNALTMTANLSHAFTTAANAKVAHMNYAYYKNASASLSSNGDNTFPLFDHFEGDAPDGKWVARSVSCHYGGGGGAVCSDSIMTLTGSYNTWFGLVAENVAKISPPFAIDYYAYRVCDGVAGAWDFVGYFYQSDTLYTGSEGTDGYVTANEGIKTQVEPTTLADWTRVKVAIYSGHCDFYEDDVLVEEVTTNVPDEAMGAFMAAAQTSGHVYVDWVFIHKYVDGLTWGTWGDEETGAQNYNESASVIIGVASSASKTHGRTKTASVIIGVVSTASRAFASSRSASVIIGTVASASKSWGVTKSAAVIIGVTATASRIAGYVRSASVVIGTVASAVKKWIAPRTVIGEAGNEYTVTATVGSEYTVIGEVGSEYTVIGEVGSEYTVIGEVGSEYTVEGEVE